MGYVNLLEGIWNTWIISVICFLEELTNSFLLIWLILLEFRFRFRFKIESKIWNINLNSRLNQSGTWFRFRLSPGCSSYLLTGQSCVPGDPETDLVFEESESYTRVRHLEGNIIKLNIMKWNILNWQLNMNISQNIFKNTQWFGESREFMV